MSCNNIDFVTFCIGNLSRRLNLSAGEVYRRLKKSGILTDYIVPSYDVLHTFGKEYLMEDLTEYMREKGVLEYWNPITMKPSTLSLKQSMLASLVR